MFDEDGIEGSDDLAVTWPTILYTDQRASVSGRARCWPVDTGAFPSASAGDRAGCPVYISCDRERRPPSRPAPAGDECDGLPRGGAGVPAGRDAPPRPVGGAAHALPQWRRAAADAGSCGAPSAHARPRVSPAAPAVRRQARVQQTPLHCRNVQTSEPSRRVCGLGRCEIQETGQVFIWVLGPPQTSGTRTTADFSDQNRRGMVPAVIAKRMELYLAWRELQTNSDDKALKTRNTGQGAVDAD